ncbi:MAG: insulinase family protein, partial [Bdellovibrionaceae bacterium]|nr:insulinase family protein [Pseudobdellovibrionaceae bacterium]
MLKFKRSELENGIRVLTELHPQSHAVSIGIWVLTGTRDEKPGEEGLAHFLEHLVFKGTKTRTAYQIARSLESLGGELNAFTTREHTCYHALVLKDHWFEALDVLSDLVCNMSLSQKDFRLEKGVVLAEIASSNENNEEYVYDFFFERVFANHSLGRPILGTVKSISEMTQKQVRDYYRRHYSGGNIIVSAAGHIDHEELVSGVRKLLRNKKKVRIDRGRKPPRWRRVRAVLEKPSEQVLSLIHIS